MPAAKTSISPSARMFGELIIVTMCLAGALPAAIAIYPQTLRLNVKDLEPEFHHLRNKKNGEPIEFVYANKGI